MLRERKRFRKKLQPRPSNAVIVLKDKDSSMEEITENNKTIGPVYRELDTLSVLPAIGGHIRVESNEDSCSMLLDKESSSKVLHEETMCNTENKVEPRKWRSKRLYLRQWGNVNNISVNRSFPLPLKRKLLILDLNGLLADIVMDYPRYYRPDMRLKKKAVFKRPFCEEFLQFCFENFDIAIWSSRRRDNVDLVVNFLMGKLKDKLLFSWDQSQCTRTGFSTVENRKKPLVLKELKKVWDKEEPNLPWAKGHYNPSNTLLLDDSPYKALCNPAYSAVFPPSYSYRDKNDSSLGPGGDLRVYLEKLLEAEHVPSYVKKHPFGQRRITNSNPSWPFYLRVIKHVDSSSLSPDINIQPNRYGKRFSRGHPDFVEGR